MRKLVPPGWRTIIVVSLAAVLVGMTFALAGGGAAGSRAVHGLAGAGNSATAGSSLASGPATSSFGPTVIDGIYQGESPPVSQLPILPVTPGPLHTRDNESLQTGSTDAQDPVVQHRKGSGALSAPIQNFDGICLPYGPPCAQQSSCNCLPPNTSGECQAHNDGDPVVLYDQLARRWLISQFIATPSGDPGDDQYGECIAVSTSSDATGSYYLYEFLFGPDVFFDYPKLGVWPDGYYMMANEFPSTSVTSSGTGVFAFERSKMLQGQPARVVFFDESQHNPAGGQYIGMLPGDLDGSRLPPSGSPNWFAEVDDPTGVPSTDPGDTGYDMRLWAFHVDWTNPASSTFGKDGAPNATMPVAPFARPQCVYGYGDCVPQEGGPQELDVLGD